MHRSHPQEQNIISKLHHIFPRLLMFSHTLIFSHAYKYFPTLTNIFPRSLMFSHAFPTCLPQWALAGPIWTLRSGHRSRQLAEIERNILNIFLRCSLDVTDSLTGRLVFFGHISVVCGSLYDGFCNLEFDKEAITYSATVGWVWNSKSQRHSLTLT